MRNIGVNHLRRALALPGVTVAALADKNAQRLDTAASLVGGNVMAFASVDTLLASDDVDAVVLAVPNHLHAALAIAAMREGKSVLVEKPMAMNPTEARKMIDARDETGCLLMVGMNQRFAPAHVAARRMIADGAIGSVLQCRTRWLLDRPFAGLWGRGDWFLSSSQSGGGPLLDLGIHRLDLALYLVGFPKVTQATGIASSGVGKGVAASMGRRYELEDYALGVLRFADGAMLTVEASYFLNVPGKVQDTVIVGTKGAICLGEEDVKMTVWKGNEAETATLTPDEQTATSCVEHFCRALRGDEDLIPTAEQGLQGLELVDAIYESAKTGMPVEISTELNATPAGP